MGPVWASVVDLAAMVAVGAGYMLLFQIKLQKYYEGRGMFTPYHAQCCSAEAPHRSSTRDTECCIWRGLIPFRCGKGTIRLALTSAIGK